MRNTENVLHRAKFRFRERDIQITLMAIKSFGFEVHPNHHIQNALPDPKDMPFYEVVMEKEKEGAYLVTGNLKHFPRLPCIINPAEMMRIITESRT